MSLPAEPPPPLPPLPALALRRPWYRKPGVVVAWLLTAFVIVWFGISLMLTRQSYAAYYMPAESMLPTLKVGTRVLVDKNAFQHSVLPHRGDVVVFEAPPEATTEHKDGVMFIKRILALPGETVQIKGAKITIDGDVLSEATGQEPHQFIREQLGLTPEQPIRIYSDHIQIDDKEELALTELAKKLERPGAKISLEPGQVLVNGNPEEGGFQTQEDVGYNFPDNDNGAFLVDKPESDGSYKVPADRVFVLGDNRNRSADSHIWGPLDIKRLQGRVIFQTGK